MSNDFNAAEMVAARVLPDNGGPSDQGFPLTMLTQYNAWCNKRMFAAMESLPEGEATKERPTRFINMVHTMNHIYVIDCIFKAHLQERLHHYAARNTSAPPSLSELRSLKENIDQWYVDLAESLSVRQLSERIGFQYVGGAPGVMSRREMILHIVNHGTYHRGIIADMLYQVPVVPPVSDITVYVRDIIRA